MADPHDSIGQRSPEPSTFGARSLIREAAIASCAATLLFAGQLRATLHPMNGFYLVWTRSDGLALVLAILLVATLLLAIGLVGRRTGWGWLERSYVALLALALAQGIFAIVLFGALPDVNAWWFIGIFVVTGLAVAPGGRLWRTIRGSFLILSPLVVILFYQVLASPVWGPERQPKPDVATWTERPARPVYFFVLDQWSWQRSTENGVFLPLFRNLRRLSDRAFVFQAARSPALHTRYVLPMIVYQADIRGEAEDVPWSRDAPHLTQGRDSIFELARRAGYRTTLIGFYLPYARALGGELDYCFCPAHAPKGRSLGEKVWLSALNNLRYLKDPLSEWLARDTWPRAYSRNWYRLNLEFEAEVLWVASRWPRNTLALIHWPLPHHPFVFNVDGSYFGHHGGDHRGPNDDAGYRRHLAYLDVVLGRVFDALERANRLEDALLILTADHGHWADEDKQHVPLLVKLPGQSRSHVVTQPIATNRLGAVIRSCLRGDLSEDRFLRLIREGR